MLFLYYWMMTGRFRIKAARPLVVPPRPGTDSIARTYLPACLLRNVSMSDAR